MRCWVLPTLILAGIYWAWGCSFGTATFEDNGSTVHMTTEGTLLCCLLVGMAGTLCLRIVLRSLRYLRYRT